MWEEIESYDRTLGKTNSSIFCLFFYLNVFLAVHRLRFCSCDLPLKYHFTNNLPPVVLTQPTKPLVADLRHFTIQQNTTSVAIV